MEVRCPSCNTRYELDVQLLQDGPVRIQCTRCDSTFRVESNKPAPGAWKIRRHADQSILEIDGLHTLQRWIVERKVTRRDAISRTGQHWKKLGSITELSSFFAVIDALDDATGEVGLPEVDDGLDALDAIQDDLTLEQSVSESDDGEAVEADDEADLTEALLASLSVEKPQQRRPISASTPSVPGEGSDDIATLFGEGHPAAADVDVQLEPPAASATLISYPKPGGTEPDVAGRVLPEIDPRKDQRVEKVVSGSPRAQSAGRRPVETDESEPLEQPPNVPTEPEPKPEPAASTATEVDEDAPTEVADAVDIGDTGADWFDDSTEPSALDLGDDVAVPQRSAAPVLVAVVGILVIGAVAVAVLAGGESDGDALGSEEETAAASDSDQRRTTAPKGKELPDGAIAANERSDVSGGTPADEAPSAPANDATSDPDAAAGDATTSDATATGANAADATSTGDDATDDASATAANESNGNESNTNKGGSRRSRYKTYLKRGDRARSRGDYQEAIRSYERAITSKRTAEAYGGLGWTYLSMGNAHKATSFFRKAVRISATYGDGWIGLGKAYQKQGKKQKALEAYESYLAKLPSGSQASIARAQGRKLRRAIGETKPTPTNDGGETDGGKAGTAGGGETTTSGGDTGTADGGETSTSDGQSGSGGDDGKKVIIIKKQP